MKKLDLYKVYKDIFDVPTGKRKGNFSKYFYGYKEADFKKKIDLFFEEYANVNQSYIYDEEVYGQVMKDVVSHYSNNKDALISVYRLFDEHLKSKYGIETNVAYPPIPTANSFERLMYIAKYLQDKEAKISDLQDILWQSSRTIEADLAKLFGNDGDPLQICGKTFIIDEVHRSMGRVDFGSTAHPMFLTCNLTQIIAILEGLKVMGDKPEYIGYALPVAREVWAQLSDYGKKRIKYVAENLMTLDLNWYESLEGKEEYSYHTELECSHLGDSALLYCLKSDEKRVCVIEYGDEESIEFLENVKVLMLDNNGWKVSVNGEERVLEGNKIIRSSYHKENMY